MNTPTRQAPHICDQVLAKISPTCLRLTRSRIAVMIHETRIAVPPTNGVQLNAAVIFAPGVIAELAATSICSRRIDGKPDQGPVQATTTTTGTAIGNQAQRMSLPVNPCAATCVSPTAGWPP